MASQAKIADAVVSKVIISAERDETVGHLLTLLRDNEISSVPIIENGKSFGFVDYLDLLKYLVEVLQEEKSSRVTPPSKSLHTDDLSIIMERSNEFNLRTVQEKSLRNKSHHDPSICVGLSDPLTAATRHFTTTGAHRVCVTDSRGNVCGILSASDVLRWAQQDAPHRLKDLDMPVSTLIEQQQHGEKSLFSLPSSQAAVDCFVALEASHHTGASLVDEEGRLVGCLSSSDLKGLTTKSFIRLLDSAGMWTHVSHGKLRWVTPNMTLANVVKRMTDLRLHRIFVVDNEKSMKPIGVITLKDVLKHLQE